MTGPSLLIILTFDQAERKTRFLLHHGAVKMVDIT